MEWKQTNDTDWSIRARDLVAARYRAPICWQLNVLTTKFGIKVLYTGTTYII